MPSIPSDATPEYREATRRREAEVEARSRGAINDRSTTVTLSGDDVDLITAALSGLGRHSITTNAADDLADRIREADDEARKQWARDNGFIVEGDVPVTGGAF